MQTSTPIKSRQQIPPGPDSGYFSPHDSFAASEAFSFEMLDISFNEESEVDQSAHKSNQFPFDFCDLEVNSLTESDSEYELPFILNSPSVRFQSRSAPAVSSDQYSKQALFHPIEKLQDRSASWNLGSQNIKYSPIDICLGRSRASTPRHQQATVSTKDVATQTLRCFPGDYCGKGETNRGIPPQDECYGQRTCQNYEIYHESPRAQQHRPDLQTNIFPTSHPNPQTQHHRACRNVGRRLAQIGNEINADYLAHRMARGLVETVWHLTWNWLNFNYL